MAEILLEMKQITKTFPGVKALDNVNLKVEKGEIHALVGENGAGKSTLMNVLSGIYPYGSYEGDIIYNGEVYVRKGEVLHTGKIDTLKRFKDDVTEVKAGYECGIRVTGFDEYQEGDRIECFEILEVRPSL